MLDGLLVAGGSIVYSFFYFKCSFSLQGLMFFANPRFLTGLCFVLSAVVMFFVRNAVRMYEFTCKSCLEVREPSSFYVTSSCCLLCSVTRAMELACLTIGIYM